VRVVTAYRAPAVATDSAGAYFRAFEKAEATARRRVADAIDRSGGGLVVDHVVALGPIDKILLEHSADAAMIVVGVRPNDSWIDRLRPSLTSRLVERARVPVVAAPPRMAPAHAA
ncbi:MAG: universal stress protein, partial [Acidimicrobiales bacterium]|nr:universal stress protein [Acidimicrobiales bacterium]